MTEVWTTRRILEWIEGYLSEKGIDNPRLSAQWRVADAMGCSRIDLYADIDRPLSESEREVLRESTKRRGTGEPLQYITGTCDFRFLSYFIEPGVLIPRPETEVLVSEALAALPKDEEILALDLCTGSGNIACSLASENPLIHVFATDLSPEACALAQRNVDHLGLSEQVLVMQGDLGSPLPDDIYGKVGLVISNPPYIPSNVLSGLDAEVKDFEPSLALDGGPDGLEVFRRIVPFAHDALRTGGLFACELHEGCLDAAAEIAQKAGFTGVRIVEDLVQKPRVLIAQKS